MVHIYSKRILLISLVAFQYGAALTVYNRGFYDTVDVATSYQMIFVDIFGRSGIVKFKTSSFSLLCLHIDFNCSVCLCCKINFL